MIITAIIQARMGSSRLPGKILKKVNGKTLLEYQLERVRRSKRITQIVIATTTEKIDDEIEKFCLKNKIAFYRGSEQDVLDRYYQASLQFSSDIIIRLTSDCPLIDPDIIDLVVEEYLKRSDHIDYVSNTLNRTYPRGMDVEVFSSKLLNEVNDLAKEEYEREHVTPYIYLSNKYLVEQVIDTKDNSEYRFTVDTNEDFLLIKEILERLYKTNPFFNLEDLIELMEKEPNLHEINMHVEQKKIQIEELNT